MTKLLTKLTILTSIFLFFGKSYSQIQISNIKDMEKIKKGVMHVIMNNSEDEDMSEYVDVFNKYWTYSELDFIHHNDLKDHIEKNASYLSVNSLIKTVTQYRSNGSSYNTTYTYIFLELWTCDPSYFKKKAELKQEHKLTIAKVSLFTDFPTLLKPTSVTEGNFNISNKVRNWGPGLLKNYLQVIQYYLNENVDRSLYLNYFDKNEMSKLKNKTLYIPDYILIKFGMFTGDESKSHDADKIMKKYKYKYKLLPIADLNEKILNTEEEFYYLIYVKSSTDKFISVVNSKTGKIVYSQYTPVSYNIKNKDFKKLCKSM